MEDKLQQQKQEALIAEMLRDAKVGDVPSSLRTEPVIHKGDVTLEAPMVVKEISSAGYVWIWDSRTYEKVPVLYYMLPSKLRQKRPDGSYRFTTTDPGKLPARGTIKCLLHTAGESRRHYDELGFRACPKDNITNQYQLVQHMKKKHPQEWAAIEAERIEREKAEDRALQQLLLANQIERLRGTEKTEKPNALFVCDVCGADFGTQKTLDKHKKEQHK